MKKILISACLVGDKTRYDGKSNYNPLVKDLLQRFELVPFCPEVEGGLKIPRLKSEILDGQVNNENFDKVTENFNLGAQKALNICKYLGIKLAIFKEHSPSCGVHEVYNGLFQNRLIPGKGITTKLLEENGIKVISENQIEAFLNELKAKENKTIKVVEKPNDKKDKSEFKKHNNNKKPFHSYKAKGFKKQEK